MIREPKKKIMNTINKIVSCNSTVGEKEEEQTVEQCINENRKDRSRIYCSTEIIYIFFSFCLVCWSFFLTLRYDNDDDRMQLEKTERDRDPFW